MWLLWIAAALVVLWLLGVLVAHVVGFLIQIALIVAVILVIWHFVSKALKKL